MKKIFAAGLILGSICCSSAITLACGYDYRYVATATWIGGDGTKHEYWLYRYTDGNTLPDKSWTAVNAWVAGHNTAGDYLATITSEAENSFINSQLFASFSGEVWLGGYQTPNNETVATKGWTWVTPESWSYTDWGGGEPNDAGGPAHEQYLGGNWNSHWNDEGALDNIGGFLVEKTTSPVPEPASMLLFGSGLLGLASITRKRKN